MFCNKNTFWTNVSAISANMVTLNYVFAAKKCEGIAAALGADQAAVIEEPAESDDAASPQSTGKMDSQAQGGLKRYASVNI